MTGSLMVDGVTVDDDLVYAPTRYDPKWDRFALGFADGGALVVHDPRRLGGRPRSIPTSPRLGPDAATITPAALAAALRGSTAPLKARLLDQSRVAGVGNLIADEVLWRARLSPLRPAGSLTPAEVRRLHRHLGADHRRPDVIGVARTSGTSWRSATPEADARRTGPSWSGPRSGGGHRGGARPTRCEGRPARPRQPVSSARTLAGVAVGLHVVPGPGDGAVRHR